MRKLHAAALIVALIFITSWVFAAKVHSPAGHAVAAPSTVSRVAIDPNYGGGAAHLRG